MSSNVNGLKISSRNSREFYPKNIAARELIDELISLSRSRFRMAKVEIISEGI